MVNTLVLTAFSLISQVAPQAPTSPNPDPQVRLKEISFVHPLNEDVHFFSTGGEVKILQFRQQLSVESLNRFLREGTEPVLRMDLAVKATGAIDSFKVVRGDSSEIFKVVIESNQLKFVRLKEEFITFPSIQAGNAGFSAKSSDTLSILTTKNQEDLNLSNLRVLRALGIIKDAGSIVIKDQPKNEVSAAKNDKSVDRAGFLNMVDEDIGAAATPDKPKL